ncbi:GntR family transcriptional regulator [Paenibacillus dendrobii]|nr:GntR family transcriptional regulator [Paenibacillus dendrobii]
MEIPLYERIYQFILSEIHSGRLLPGERIPSENELSAKFSVSRITSKKALELLALAGFIVRHRGKGSFVAEKLLIGTESDRGFESDMTGHFSNETIKMIGVIIPDFTESYGSQLIRSIEQRCSESGYGMLLKLTHDSRESEKEAIRSLVRMGVSGLIVYPVHGEHYNDELLRLVLERFPVVTLDRYMKGIAVCSVCTDNQQAGQELTDFLLDKGHKHIAFLSTPPESTSAIEDRILGYTHALGRRNMGMQQQYLISNLSGTLPKSNIEQVTADRFILRQFIEEHPQVTGYVACEYLLAENLHQVIQETRREHDTEIVCFDAMDRPFLRPLFTHIRQHEAEMGYTAVELLRLQWDGSNVPLLTNIAHTLIVK